MKITINKNQEKLNFKKHVGTIIMIAKQKAKNGYHSFYYPIPRNQGIHCQHLIDAVELETEETVYGGYRCVKDDNILFTIRS